MNSSTQFFIRLANDNMAAISRFLQSPEIVELNRSNIETYTQIALESMARVARSSAFAELTRVVGENYSRCVNDYTRSMLDVMGQSQAIFSRQMEEASQYVEQGMRSTVNAAQSAASSMDREGREFGRNAGQMAGQAASQGSALFGSMGRTTADAAGRMTQNATDTAHAMTRNATDAARDMGRKASDAGQQGAARMQQGMRDATGQAGEAMQQGMRDATGQAAGAMQRGMKDTAGQAGAVMQQGSDDVAEATGSERRSRSDVIDFEDRRKNSAAGAQAVASGKKGAKELLAGPQNEGQEEQEIEAPVPPVKRARGGRH